MEAGFGTDEVLELRDYDPVASGLNSRLVTGINNRNDGYDQLH
jgi:hypothetical protein